MFGKAYIFCSFLMPKIIRSNPLNTFGLFTTTTFITDASSASFAKGNAADDQRHRKHNHQKF